MALLLVERRFAEALHLDPSRERAVEDLVESLGIPWLGSFLTADRLRSYCLYEAPSIEAIHELSATVGVPEGETIDVSHLAVEEALDLLQRLAGEDRVPLGPSGH